ncbi:MAG: hypothetical protein U1F27_17585 [Turneriella sp.]
MKYPVLLIDTSSRHLVFARLDGRGAGQVLIELPDGRSEDAVDNAVAKLFSHIDDIGEIWLGEGPGSFVGLRSSFAYVRMLAMLTGKPCRTFYSSRLWRALFGIAPSAWLMTRTNARLFYADRFTTARETLVVDIAAEGERPRGEVYCFTDTWISAAPAKKGGQGMGQGWKYLTMGDAQIAAGALTPENLALTQPKSPVDLNPIYGHELNFTLAKGNNG